MSDTHSVHTIFKTSFVWRKWVHVLSIAALSVTSLQLFIPCPCPNGHRAGTSRSLLLFFPCGARQKVRLDRHWAGRQDPSGVSNGTHPSPGQDRELHTKTPGKKAVKGTASRLLTVVSTGVEPLPDASSPLNLQYPGPLAEGNYLLFLRKVSGSQMYSTAGLWQGIYPIYQGKTIALSNLGFTELNQLSQEEAIRKITAISR